MWYYVKANSWFVKKLTVTEAAAYDVRKTRIYYKSHPIRSLFRQTNGSYDALLMTPYGRVNIYFGEFFKEIVNTSPTFEMCICKKP